MRSETSRAEPVAVGSVLQGILGSMHPSRYNYGKGEPQRDGTLRRDRPIPAATEQANQSHGADDERKDTEDDQVPGHVRVLSPTPRGW